MGHKGVSKRKPKKSKMLSNVNSSSDAHLVEGAIAQSLVKENPAPNKGSLNSVAGSNKKKGKGR
jgi:hypothetical protein